MKKFVTILLMCVFLIVPAFQTEKVYAFYDEEIVFTYNNKEFKYKLSENIRTDNQFYVNFNLNKYNRNSNKEQRVEFLKHLLEIGTAKDIALEYLFPNLNQKLNSISKNIYIKARNATLEINSNSIPVFKIKKEIIGVDINREEIYNNLLKAYINNLQLKFTIPIIKTTPEITAKDLEKFTNLRASYSTNISNSSPDRKHNIKNAMQSLNKIEIAPNEIFSFNKTVGRRSIENGYRQAKIIVNNEFTDGIGGGVCQVSSTLYNTALLAGLEIIEANKHSKQVGYVPFGFDAMVNFGSSDLRFKNNTSEKITLITNYSPNKIQISIYGQSLNGITYKTHNEVYNIEEPIEEIYTDEKQEYVNKVQFSDEYFYLKSGTKGMEIKSYRETLKDGKPISKEPLRHDKFKAQNSIKIYGALDRNKKSTEEVCA